MSIRDNLLRMLKNGQDNALLRFSLGNEFFKADDPAGAMPHLEAAVRHDPDYSAAWKLLGKARVATNRPADAAEAYRAGIEAAGRKGDVQAAREMGVFLKRIEKTLRKSEGG